MQCGATWKTRTVQTVRTVRHYLLKNIKNKTGLACNIRIMIKRFYLLPYRYSDIDLILVLDINKLPHPKHPVMVFFYKGIPVDGSGLPQ